MALEVRGLRVDAGRLRILDEASLHARRGEIVTVVGPNGAGKTTLLECIVGLRRAEAGTVSFEGREVRGLRACARVFSFMPDAGDAPDEATVEEVLDHAARVAGVPREDVPELPRDARVAVLSRGEKRRLALSIALSTARPVLVLDEPLSAFDPLQVRKVVATLRARAARGTTVVASVHQMSDAEKLGDRVAILARGRVVAFGTLDELRARIDDPSANLEQIFVRLLAGAGDVSA